MAKIHRLTEVPAKIFFGHATWAFKFFLKSQKMVAKALFSIDETSGGKLRAYLSSKTAKFGFILENFP